MQIELKQEAKTSGIPFELFDSVSGPMVSPKHSPPFREAHTASEINRLYYFLE